MIRKMSTLVALYFAIWIIPLLLYILYTIKVIGFRHMVFEETTSYIIQLLTIVISILTIYLCLKLFKFKFVVNSITSDPGKSLQTYINWNTLRYIWYILIITGNLFVYDTTDTGHAYLAMAGALLLSAYFCFPSESECSYISAQEEKNK